MVTNFSIFEVHRRNLPKRKTGTAQLSPREAEVLTWTAKGKTCFEISLVLNIAEETVRSHVKNACQRLAAVNKIQAVAIAMTLSLIVPFTSVKFSMDTSIPHLGNSKTNIQMPKLKHVLCLPMQAENRW